MRSVSPPACGLSGVATSGSNIFVHPRRLSAIGVTLAALLVANTYAGFALYAFTAGPPASVPGHSGAGAGRTDRIAEKRAGNSRPGVRSGHTSTPGAGWIRERILLQERGLSTKMPDAVSTSLPVDREIPVLCTPVALVTITGTQPCSLR